MDNGIPLWKDRGEGTILIWRKKRKSFNTLPHSKVEGICIWEDEGMEVRKRITPMVRMYMMKHMTKDDGTTNREQVI